MSYDCCQLNPGEDCDCTTPSWCTLSDCPRRPQDRTTNPINEPAHDQVRHCGLFGDAGGSLKPFCWKEPGHIGAHCTCNGAKICDGCRGLWDERVTACDLYAELDRVLTMARSHAAHGKGKERHALPDQPFEEQVIVADSVALGSNHGNLLQIIKKAKESARLTKDAAIAELLGVINNAAAAVLVLERLDEAKK